MRLDEIKVTGYAFVDDMVLAFNQQLGSPNRTPLDVKDRGTRVWTRGDGSRYKDPGYIALNSNMTPKEVKQWIKIKPVQQFWNWLVSQPGVKNVGNVVRGEFGSNPIRPAVTYKGLYFAYNDNGYPDNNTIEWGSISRYKNPRSVWHVHKDNELTEAGMPASIIKAKQRWSMMSPEEMLAAFTEVSERTGKSVQELATNAARRHGYKDINTYWHRISSLITEAKSPAQAAIENLAERIAAKYRANEYDEFEQEMHNLLRPEQLRLANLPELFDLYNPHRQREGGEIWARMMKEPEKYINSK